MWYHFNYLSAIQLSHIVANLATTSGNVSDFPPHQKASSSKFSEFGSGFPATWNGTLIEPHRKNNGSLICTNKLDFKWGFPHFLNNGFDKLAVTYYLRWGHSNQKSCFLVSVMFCCDLLVTNMFFSFAGIIQPHAINNEGEKGCWISIHNVFMRTWTSHETVKSCIKNEPYLRFAGHDAEGIKPLSVAVHPALLHPAPGGCAQAPSGPATCIWCTLCAHLWACCDWKWGCTDSPVP